MKCKTTDFAIFGSFGWRILCLHNNIYKYCGHKRIMVYTETRSINGRKYYYRVISLRKKRNVSKKRVYLGCELSDSELLRKEKMADKKLVAKRNLREINMIKSKIVKILKNYNVKRAGVFGSYSRGDQKKDSDIDIAVEIEDSKMSLLGFIKLIKLLEEALRRKVDLVEYDAIKSRIKEGILKEEIRII